MLKKIAKKTRRIIKGPLIDYRYSIDTVTPTLIGGWAKNVKLPHHSPVIDIYVNGDLTWQAKSNQKRPDLTDADIGDFAFTLIPDPSVMTSDCREVEIRIDGHKLGRKFPLELKVESESIANSNPKQTPLSRDDFLCHVDVIGDSKLSGWAKLKDHDDVRVTVELRANNCTFGSNEASNFRQDLLVAGYGDGKYAFEIEFDLASFPTQTIETDLYINGILYSEEKIIITADPKAIEHAKYLRKFAPELTSLQQALKHEMSKIKLEIEGCKEGNTEFGDIFTVLLQRVVELSVRIEIMEKAMLTYLSNNDRQN